MAMCTALYTGHDTYMAKVKFVADDLAKHTDDFDGIISSGLSGLMIAAPVALKLGKTLGVVRHTDERRHPGDHAGLILIERACFLDDFISAGRTFRQCHDALKAARDPNGISERDLAYYMQQYGEAWIRENHPQWLKPETVERNIVAVYQYDRADNSGVRYTHVTNAGAVYLNTHRKLWPPELFEALHTGKKPPKSEAKQVPVRDEQGRFAPKPAAPVRKRTVKMPARRGQTITITPSLRRYR